MRRFRSWRWTRRYGRKETDNKKNKEAGRIRERANSPRILACRRVDDSVGCECVGSAWRGGGGNHAGPPRASAPTQGTGFGAADGRRPLPTASSRGIGGCHTQDPRGGRQGLVRIRRGGGAGLGSPRRTTARVAPTIGRRQCGFTRNGAGRTFSLTCRERHPPPLGEEQRAAEGGRPCGGGGPWRCVPGETPAVTALA